VKSDDLILEAFKCMKDNKIGGVPVVEGPKRKLVGSVSIRDIRFLLLRPDLFSNFRYKSILSCDLLLLCIPHFPNDSYNTGNLPSSNS
jgi:predicted transcriptional regulator